jgi:hypothetical protein
MSSSLCEHSLLGIVPIVPVRVSRGGYVGRCLLCDARGPVRKMQKKHAGRCWRRERGLEREVRSVQEEGV